MIKLCVAENSNKYRIASYKKALVSARELNVNTVEDVKKMGLGDKLTNKLITLIQTGEDFEELKDKSCPSDAFQTAYGIFTKIHGIGDIKAKELITKHNLFTIDELKDKLQTCPGLLNRTQLLGLEFMEDFSLRIPREEMTLHHEHIQNIFTENRIEGGIMGSFRRGKENSGDIDVIFIDETDTWIMNKVVALLKGSYLYQSQFALGDTKFMGICQLPGYPYRRIDIMRCNTRSEYSFARLYFTGSKLLNTQMRTIALEKGYTLNEKGIYNATTGERVANDFPTEESIFHFLEIPYLEPNQRENGILNYEKQ